MTRTRESLERRLDEERKSLNLIEEQIAKHTELEAPIHLLKQRDDTEERIAQIEEQLRRIPISEPEPSASLPSPPDGLESSKRQIERPQKIQIGDKFSVKASKTKQAAAGKCVIQIATGGVGLLALSLVLIALVSAVRGGIEWWQATHPTPTLTPTKTPKPSPVAVVLVGPPTATATDIPSPTSTHTPLPEARKLCYFLILDASSRMADRFQGSDSKWTAAQESALDLLTSGLPSRANYGLIVLGGDQPGSTQTCDDSNQILIPLSPDQRETVIEQIENLEPQGVASLTGAIALARDQLLDLPGDLEKTIFVITGGGDICHPDDEWESLLDLLELSIGSIKAQVDLIILADESLDEEVQSAARDIIRLGLENVRADVSSDEEELASTTDDAADRAVERAREVEPVAIAAEETVVAATATAVVVAPPPPTAKLPATIPEATVVAGVTPSPGAVTHTATPTLPPTPLIAQPPTPTSTPTDTPIPTETAVPPTSTPTATPTNTSTSTPTAIPSPSPTITLTSTPSATPTPTVPPITLTPLPPQNDVYAQNCPLSGQTTGFNKFESNEATISASLMSGGHTGQGLRLEFTALNRDYSYSGWEVVLGNTSGVDLTSYSSLTFYIRGAAGGETPNVWLMMPVEDSRRYYRDVEIYRQVTTQWQEVVIPLVDFTTGTEPEEEIDLHHIHKIQVVFEWYQQPTSGTIYIDDLCVQ